MIRKLLCWLGWHEWEEKLLYMEFRKPDAPMFAPDYSPVYGFKCKHCGKVKI